MRTIAVKDARQYIADARTFKTRSTTSGLWATDAPSGTGQLPAEYHAGFRDEATYVVYSYATPIAWISYTGQRVVPEVKYSPTTSQHQKAVRMAWGV